MMSNVPQYPVIELEPNDGWVVGGTDEPFTMSLKNFQFEVDARRLTVVFDGHFHVGTNGKSHCGGANGTLRIPFISDLPFERAIGRHWLGALCRHNAAEFDVFDFGALLNDYSMIDVAPMGGCRFALLAVRHDEPARGWYLPARSTP